MKKCFIKTITIICLVCILMLATLSACNDNSSDKDNSNDEFYYDVASFVISSGGLMNSDSNKIVKQIDSSEQLISFCNETKLPINDKNDWDYERDYYKKLRSYDKKFFKNKSLIIVFISKGYPYGLEFSNFRTENDTMTVNILNHYDPYRKGVSYPCMEEGYLFLIEFNKNSIKDVNQIEVKEYNYIAKENLL